MHYRCYQIKLRAKHIKTNRQRCEAWLDIYHWSVGVAMTGRICDNGQSVLQSSFQTGISAIPRYLQIYFLIEFLEEALIRIKIILCVNYTIIYFSNTNAVIHDNLWRITRPYFFFKIAVDKRKVFFAVYGQYGHAPSNVSPALTESVQYKPNWRIPKDSAGSGYGHLELLSQHLHGGIKNDHKITQPG
jgi:hypothetical protein